MIEVDGVVLSRLWKMTVEGEFVERKTISYASQVPISADDCRYLIEVAYRQICEIEVEITDLEPLPIEEGRPVRTVVLTDSAEAAERAARYYHAHGCEVDSITDGSFRVTGPPERIRALAKAWADQLSAGLMDDARASLTRAIDLADDLGLEALSPKALRFAAKQPTSDEIERVDRLVDERETLQAREEAIRAAQWEGEKGDQNK